MTAAEIRKTFLDFFASKQHQIVPSAPIVVKNDPTLMFTNAGMNQFKDYFLGNAIPANPRIADTQKCLRVSGKHNDLEEVGVDTYHHTMFEMLGNWSFGNYFKKEAIEWAWELLTEVYKIPKEKLYVTIFEGDAKECLERDMESYNIWKNLIAEDRILLGNKKDNFWEMGDTGPCGPCTEIHVDCRKEEDKAGIDGKDLVNNDHAQVIEIWNVVFIQFNRKADKSLDVLPAQHVDTGMGFERIVRVIQGKSSNYDSDVFTGTISATEKLCGEKYHFSDTKHDVAFRVIADHIRAISFAIADGQLPSNKDAGYVIRRILRRAVRYGYTYLKFTEPFLCELVPVISKQFSEVFPELHKQEAFVTKVIREEELSFFKTLSAGVKRFEDIQRDLAKQNTTTINGRAAFELFDTYGFPKDLTVLIAQENNLTVDEVEFEVALKEQKERSKAASKVENDDWVELQPSAKTNFIGYDFLEAEIKISKYRRVSSKDKIQYQLVFDQTPFYAESGGQVGDTGYIENIHERIYITDTKKENDLIVHFVQELPEIISANFTAKVNRESRQQTMNNHSATHLLHAALRSILGEHVEQKGSLVNSEYLRFDFSHFSKMSQEEMTQVELIVNQKIRENIALQEERQVPIAEAKSKGAMALFGEKYGEFVRVITFDKNYSVELCGGTHTNATGNIGMFKILSESSIAAGVRRIEATTGQTAIAYLEEKENQLSHIAEALKNPKNILKGIESLIDENSKLRKEIEKLQKIQVKILQEELKGKVQEQQGLNMIIEEINLDNADIVRDLANAMKNDIPNLFMVLGFQTPDKAMISVCINDGLLKEKNLHAGNIVKELAKEIQGGGGGQPNYATAGGTKKEGLKSALVKAKTII
ncbi:MAG: alanine--tRNA ligase [Bacteroidetes bacterium]|nr:alanine--tRNA ligase [Bacteroidota bacterium]